MQSIDISDSGSTSTLGILPTGDVRVAGIFMQSWLQGEATDRALLNQMSEPGLRILTATVADHCNEPLHVDALDRSALTRRLTQLLDDTFPVRTHGQRVKSDEVLLSSSKPWVEQIDNSAVHPRSEKQDRLLLDARQTITSQALRELRHAAGWKPKSLIQREIGNVTAKKIDQLVERTKKQKFDTLIDQGMEPEEAQQRIQKEYIAVTEFWNARRYGRVGHEYDERTSKTWVDVSPEAEQDLKARHRADMEERGRNLDGVSTALTHIAAQRRGMVSLDSIKRKWRCGTNNRAIVISILEELRREKIKTLMDTGISGEEADQKADEYIAIFPSHSLSDNMIYRYLNPQAVQDFEQRTTSRFPDTKKHSRIDRGAEENQIDSPDR